MDRYYTYSDYLIKKYGVKTYKLPVTIPVSCPNRDGNIATGGCDFCGENSGGFESLPARKPVGEQLLELKDFIAERYNAKKFIAYFQNYTNTYLPLEKLLDYLKEAQDIEDVVELSFSTRPDCLSRRYLREILKSSRKKISFEFGLQTVNYRTLKSVNRGHSLAEFLDVIMMTKDKDVDIGVHLILNLPGDTMIDVVENAKILSALKVDTVKLHALYIAKGTVFADKYERGELKVIPLEEYINRVIMFLEHLDPKIAVQRLLGRTPEENTLFVNWGLNWTKIHQMIINEMEKRDTYQGKKFDYLDGKVLSKFT